MRRIRRNRDRFQVINTRRVSNCGEIFADRRQIVVLADAPSATIDDGPSTAKLTKNVTREPPSPDTFYRLPPANNIKYDLRVITRRRIRNVILSTFNIGYFLRTSSMFSSQNVKNSNNNNIIMYTYTHASSRRI